MLLLFYRLSIFSLSLASSQNTSEHWSSGDGNVTRALKNSPAKQQTHNNARICTKSKQKMRCNLFFFFFYFYIFLPRLSMHKTTEQNNLISIERRPYASAAMYSLPYEFYWIFFGLVSKVIYRDLWQHFCCCYGMQNASLYCMGITLHLNIVRMYCHVKQSPAWQHLVKYCIRYTCATSNRSVIVFVVLLNV